MSYLTLTSLTTNRELPVPDAIANGSNEQFIDYCTAHKAYYYGRPAELFSLSEARTLARTANCNWLILDNMS